MSFDINLLDDLDDDLDSDDVEPLIESYIDDILKQFSQSPEGQAHAVQYPEIGSWIFHLIDFGYKYEGFVLSQMTKDDMKTMMEDLLPRKVALANKSEAEDAVPELVAFWSFLEREYNFKIFRMYVFFPYNKHTLISRCNIMISHFTQDYATGSSGLD
jgi:hypothetical protein